MFIIACSYCSTRSSCCLNEINVFVYCLLFLRHPPLAGGLVHKNLASITQGLPWSSQQTLGRRPGTSFVVLREVQPTYLDHLWLLWHTILYLNVDWYIWGLYCILFVPVMMPHVIEARFLWTKPPRWRWMSQKEEAVKKSIYFTKTHGLLVEQ